MAQQKTTTLTLIGKSGEGKSTSGNLILGARTFEMSAGAQACTSAIEGHQVPNTSITVYDTPGIGDTEGRSEEFFQVITDHLFEHGGVVAFVQSQTRVDQRVKNHLEALSRMLDGQPFSTCCVLITTKLSYDSSLSAEQNRQEWAKYQSDLEQECFGETHDSFARCYAYSTLLPDTRKDFVMAIKDDLPKLPGLAPRTVLTWATIVQLSENQLKDVEAKKKLLEREVERLEATLTAIDVNTKWYEDKIAHYKRAHWWSLLLGAMGYVGLKLAYKRWQRVYQRLSMQRKIVEEELAAANTNLQNLDIAALEEKARRIRELVA